MKKEKIVKPEISHLEFKKTQERFHYESNKDQITLQNGIILNFDSEEGNIEIKRDSEYELLENSVIGKTIHQLIQEINKELESDERTQFVDKVTEKGKINSIIALIVAIKTLDEEKSHYDAVEQYLAIYNDFFADITETKEILPAQLENAIAWIRKMLKVKDWKLTELSNDFHVNISGSAEYPIIKVMTEDIFVEFSRSHVEKNFKIEVMTVEKEGAIVELDHTLECKYTYNLHDDMEFIEVKEKEFSISKVNLKTLYTDYSSCFRKRISEEDLEKITEILDKIVNRVNTVWI